MNEKVTFLQCFHVWCLNEKNNWHRKAKGFFILKASGLILLSQKHKSNVIEALIIRLLLDISLPFSLSFNKVMADLLPQLNPIPLIFKTHSISASNILSEWARLTSWLVNFRDSSSSRWGGFISSQSWVVNTWFWDCALVSRHLGSITLKIHPRPISFTHIFQGKYVIVPPC